MLKTEKNMKLNRIKTIVLLATAIGLNGCSMWPEYLRPQSTLPAEYARGDASNAQANKAALANDWWTLYQDPILDSLVKEALVSNTDIKLAVARIEEADGAMREVGAALLPQINLSGSGTRSRVTEAGAFPVFAANPRENYTVQLGTSFELDFWGKLRQAKTAARAQALSTRYAKETVTLSLATLVTSNYLILRSIDSQLAVTRANLKSREASLGLTKRRAEGGVVSALDVHQAEVALANLTAQLAELERQRAITGHQLAILTGQLDLRALEAKLGVAELSTLPIPPTPPAGLPSSLLTARPDVRQAEETMIAANANIAVAKAALYPTISLTGTFGGESLALKDVLSSAARIWSTGVSLNLPIFDSGRLNSRVDQATARQKQALASYEAALQSAFKEVNDSLVNVRQQKAREDALNAAQQAAQKGLTISENRYQSGYSAYLDVLDAQRVHNDAALAFIQSRQARLVATAELFKALGGGWQDGFVAQSESDKTANKKAN